MCATASPRDAHTCDHTLPARPWGMAFTRLSLTRLIGGERKAALRGRQHRRDLRRGSDLQSGTKDAAGDLPLGPGGPQVPQPWSPLSRSPVSERSGDL